MLKRCLDLKDLRILMPSHLGRSSTSSQNLHSHVIFCPHFRSTTVTESCPLPDARSYICANATPQPTESIRGSCRLGSSGGEHDIKKYKVSSV